MTNNKLTDVEHLIDAVGHWQQDYDAVEDGEQYDFFGNIATALRELQERRKAEAVVPDDYFSSLVAAARVRADKAMRKFPQPNYVLNKVAEESGEVIKAVIHYTEGREEWTNVEGEIIDNLAMLIRLIAEGDQVIGFTPPDTCRTVPQPAPVVPDSEPVADVVAWHKEGEERTCDIRWRRFDVEPGPLYAAPQSALLLPDDMAISDDMNIYQKCFARGHNACRAAMLQGADGTLTNEGTIPGGNSPVIPDGWVMVPVEPTQEMIDAHVEGVKSGGMHKGYRAMLAVAPDFRGISNSSTKHFRGNAETSTNELVSESYKLPATLIKAMQSAIDQLDRRAGKVERGYPQHSHTVSGVWDQSNGRIANEPCSVCALWDEMREYLSAAPQQEIKS